jgi:excisionase family DNA binding protein
LLRGCAELLLPSAAGALALPDREPSYAGSADVAPVFSRKAGAGLPGAALVPLWTRPTSPGAHLGTGRVSVASEGDETSASPAIIYYMGNTDGTIRRLLTVAEVAEELRVTRGTAYRWIRTGSLPAIRIGGTVRVPAKQLVDRLARSAISWQSARSAIGRVATIRGRVAGTRFASSSSGSPTFLNLGVKLPEPPSLHCCDLDREPRRFRTARGPLPPQEHLRPRARYELPRRPRD